jgi:hypothetical protein
MPYPFYFADSGKNGNIAGIFFNELVKDGVHLDSL